MRGVVRQQVVDVEAEGCDKVDDVDGTSYEIENVRAGNKSKQNYFKLLSIKLNKLCSLEELYPVCFELDFNRSLL